MRTCVHAGDLHFEKGDVSALVINQLFKLEKSVGRDEMALSEIAHALALSSVYPKQIEFVASKSASVPDYATPMKMYRLDIKGSIGFLVDKTRRGIKRRHR